MTPKIFQPKDFDNFNLPTAREYCAERANEVLAGRLVKYYGTHKDGAFYKDKPGRDDRFCVSGLEPERIVEKPVVKKEITREKLHEVLSIYKITGHAFQDVAERLGL